LPKLTYCLAIAVDEGLLFASDSRTNAGPDQLSTHTKMHVYGLDGARQIVLLSAGNVALTQAIVTRLRRDMEADFARTLAGVRDLLEAAEYVGEVSRDLQAKHGQGLAASGGSPEVTFILGGQIGTEQPGIFLIYPQGNYLSCSEHEPFLQIGEAKYGKPVLARIIRRETPLADATRCALVSMDSTMRSNATVGPPVELLVYRRDSLKIDSYASLGEDDPYVLETRAAWNQKIVEAFGKLPGFSWDGRTEVKTPIL
jgi:putative proteasome-type protease